MLREPEVGRRPEAGAALSVIVINDFAGVTGGSDRVALAEAEGLARRGHRVTLIAGQGTPSPRLLEAGVSHRSAAQPTIIEDPHRIGAAARGIWNRSAAALVVETLRGLDPRHTVVHLHGFTKVLSASVARAAVRSGLPTVATLHDYFAACPNGGFFNYRAGQVCHLDPLSLRCVATHCDSRSFTHKLWRVGRSGIQRSLGSMPAGVADLIVPSRTAGDVLRPFLPPDSRLHVLPNAVPVPRLPPVRPSSQEGFVFLGRLDHDKGPTLLAEAASQARVPVSFVGAGEELELVRQVYPEAELTGWIDHERVQEVLGRARALVNASLWYETHGLSALEAAARGVPAVVPDHGALRDAVVDGETGLWFRGGDVDDLADKLTRLAEDDALVDRLGQTAYDCFWSGQWDLETHLDRLEAVYRTALG
jgi:glycosyltransferase involved in cell wall biosynthesis